MKPYPHITSIVQISHFFLQMRNIKTSLIVQWLRLCLLVKGCAFDPWLPDVKIWFIWKDPDVGKDWKKEAKGMTEYEMVGWHHRLNGHGFGWTPGVGDGHGGLACCGSWGCKELDTAEQLNWTEYSTVCMYHSFLIHSSADGHLGYFPVLAIVNNAVMNTGVHVSLSILVFLVFMPSSGIAGS